MNDRLEELRKLRREGQLALLEARKQRVYRDPTNRAGAPEAVVTCEREVLSAMPGARYLVLAEVPIKGKLFEFELTRNFSHTEIALKYIPLFHWDGQGIELEFVVASANLMSIEEPPPPV